MLLCAHSREFSASKDQSKILTALKKPICLYCRMSSLSALSANGKLTEYCQLVFNKGCNNIFRKQIIGTSFWLSTMWWWSDTGLEQRWHRPGVSPHSQKARERHWDTVEQTAHILTPLLQRAIWLDPPVSVGKECTGHWLSSPYRSVCTPKPGLYHQCPKNQSRVQLFLHYT